MTRLIRLAVPLLAAWPAFAAGRVECGSVKSPYMPTPVGYCALLPASYDAQPTKKFPTLYYLHGLGADQSFLISTGGWNVIEDAQQQKKIGEMVVITPDAHASFYINSRDGRVRYEDFFIRDFIPQMEKKFRLIGNRSGRGIGGISMGGYGALRFAFKYPRMFGVVAAQMPALLEQLPHGAAKAGVVAFIGPAFGRPADEAFWKANTPFVYARTVDLHGLKVYFNCGDHDDYGFDAGAREMDKLLAGRHVPHEAHIYSGTHDFQFVAAHIEEALTFVSKGLGLK